ncbi:hypothetical protein [Streptomyces sp. NPDC002521]
MSIHASMSLAAGSLAFLIVLAVLGPRHIRERALYVLELLTRRRSAPTPGEDREQRIDHCNCDSLPHPPSGPRR